jgi:tRNA(Met) cytidine acetyltransferase
VTQSNICSWFETLTQQLRNNRHRSLVVLHGENQWSKDVSTRFIQQLHHDKTRVKKLRSITWGEKVVDKEHSDVIGNFRHHLGGENDIVLFNDNQFHPDAFAALSGSIVAGGVLIWVCSSESILNVDNLFIQRLWAKVQNDQHSYILSQTNDELPNIFNPEQASENVSKEIQQTKKIFTPVEGGCKTYEQQHAVAAIAKVTLGHRNRPLVLTADRGRGKSSALAIAVVDRLMSESMNEPQKIVITAPHIDALAIFFQQLQHSCPNGEYQQNVFTYKEHSVEFIAVDVLIKDTPTAHLLLVDEAAAIPVYILSQLVDDYHRIVFSSTQHGYEGAGRGFAVKFKQVLANKTPNYNQFHLHQPIRWAENDPLEMFVFDAFLLKSSLFNTTHENNFSSHSDNKKSLKIEKAVFKCIEQQQLFENEQLLQQVFSVLVTAHYQTSPSDLKLLLNNRAIRLFVTEIDNEIMAVALTLKEGNVEIACINDVAKAKRRLKNQFLPQSLFLHNHCSTAFDYQYLRIMRIAVLPDFQQQGLGVRLLAEIKQYAQQHHIDMLGTSFGANHSLLDFWHKANYRIVRLGFSVDKASGEHSTMYLQPLTAKAFILLDELQTQFYRSFIYLLTEQYQKIAVKVVTFIINQWPKEKLPELTHFDRQVVGDFIERKSLFDTCVYSLHIQLIHSVANNFEIYRQDSEADLKINEMLVRRVLQKQNSASICQAFGLTGKKQFNNAMIEGFKAIIAKC